MLVELSFDNILDVNKANEEFTIFVKIIPEFIGGNWAFMEELFEEPYEYKYPIDNEDYSEYINSNDKKIFLFYEKNNCVGQIILKKYWNKNTYIQDICVAKNCRNKGIGYKLMDKAVEWTKMNGLKGIMLETQDVNIIACKFYKKYGFILGGVDTMLYSNFKNADQKALFWYYKIKE